MKKKRLWLAVAVMVLVYTLFVSQRVVRAVRSVVPETEEAAEQISAEEPAENGEDELEAGQTEGVPVQNEQTDSNMGLERSLPTGQVDVSIGPALVLQKPVTFTAVLTGQEPQSVTLAADGAAQDSQTGASFSSLTPGNYQLTVTAPGFAAYTQEIAVGSQGVSVSLMTGFAEGIPYQEEGAHPGVLLIGDVTRDGAVDDADAESLINSVDENERGNGNSYSEAADLNGDGKVDLVDLQYMAKGYHTKACTATPEKFIPSAVITVLPGNGTIIKGDTAALLQDEGSVALAPENGALISEANPVSLVFDVAEAGDANLADGIVVRTGNDNPIRQATVELTYTDTDGSLRTAVVPVQSHVEYLLKDTDVYADFDTHGNIQIHLGSQVAVKKVTLTISGMQKNNNLAEISQVQFVNGMENRIPEPQMDIPENLRAEAGSREFTLTWDKCVNITGYEVLVEQGGQSQTYPVTGNFLKVTSFGEKELVNKTEYTVKVQSVNGTWRSGYCDAVTVIPKVDKRPDRPDNVSAQGQYRGIAVSWKKVKDADSYNLYYKEKQAASYEKVEGILSNSHTLTDLMDMTEYTLYVTAVNELGESDPSLASVAKTTDIEPADMPRYKLINYNEKGEPCAGIVSATTGRSNAMYDSPLDTGSGTVWGTVDKDPRSYYQVNTWDDGGFNKMALSHGLTYEFDQVYTIQKIALQEIIPNGNHYFYARVRYWDGEGEHTVSVSIARKSDENGRPYYLLTLPEKVKTNKIQIGLARYQTGAPISVSEVYFYNYDTLEEDIMALYKDDLHMELKPEVNQETIDGLRKRLNTPDERSGEYHPDRELLERELKNAEDILNNTSLDAPVEIHQTISTSDVNRGFGGLNAWQPIGITAAAGESVTIYVGHNTKKPGQDTNLQLVATQYHAESSPMAKTVTTLKVGVNVIDIPRIGSGDAEAGGALYIQYTGNNANDRYAVRVSGGVKVPRLDLYQVTDPAERQRRAEVYVEELKEYTANIENLHKEVHEKSGNSAVQYAYGNGCNCILGATDILLKDMMLSLPAAQVLNGCGAGSTQEQAAQMIRSMDAMENMMTLFYQHKGLNDSAKDEKDRTPKRHLNIRYQRMFAGAFMYAAGTHIGIEWNETAGMMRSTPVVADSNGKYISGSYFGWGIAHEIGHCINQSAYAIAEITNNYFAQLAQAKDSNNSVRFKYDKIYEKVTSGTTGASPNVATQLGMYWQLHLAYDNNYNYKTFQTYEEQLDGLFFARVDTYARDVSKAPGDIGLKLSGDREQDLMRLSCAAAQKNILEFFRRWGKVPDADTIAYAEQFEEETRAIYYANDDARVYRFTNKGSILGQKGQVNAVGTDTTAVISDKAANQVDFHLTSRNISKEDVLGYEIVRCMISGGETQRQVVGFATEETFSDYITSINNRVVSYEVTLIDKYLNRSKTVSLGALKIEHDGSLDKADWTVTANGLKALDAPEAGVGDDNMPCEPVAEDPLLKMIDQDTTTVYTGKADANGEIVIDFHKNQVITGFKYTAADKNPIAGYDFYVKSEDGKWNKAASGTLGGSKTVYFENPDGKYVSTYDTSAVKLVFTKAQKTVAVAELDILGVTGDNIDFRRTEDGTVTVGRLTEEYQYGGEGEVIPAQSIVFTGSYKGNPAYNVVMLYDQDGNLVGGRDSQGNLVSSQIILADVPAEGAVQNVSDGTWIYWIEPGNESVLDGLKQVRAELYRVNNAMTNEGQRLVSDSLFLEVPRTLPGITLTGNAEKQ